MVPFASVRFARTIGEVAVSRSELLDAYRRGTLSRRAFVRGMTALGVSIATANHLADRVAASSKPADDVYDAGDHTPTPAKPIATSSEVTMLPSTGEGETADASSQSSRATILGLLGASAAFAAAGLRRLRRTALDADDQH